MNKEEVEAGRRLLSAVVVHKSGDQIPGDGFFKLARELGRYKGGDKTIYWAVELKRVYQEWQT